jgi:hypothetical protein
MILVNQARRAERIKALEKWRRWFAWYPVVVRPSGDVVWWEEVERKSEYICGYDGQYCFTYFRRIGDSYE